jgi:hypothetical protein
MVCAPVNGGNLAIQQPRLLGEIMTDKEMLALLTRARTVLDHYLFDEATEAVRDDVAQVCMAIDDALPNESRVSVRRSELDRELKKSAA